MHGRKRFTPDSQFVLHARQGEGMPAYMLRSVDLETSTVVNTAMADCCLVMVAKAPCGPLTLHDGNQGELCIRAITVIKINKVYKIRRAQKEIWCAAKHDRMHVNSESEQCPVRP